MPEWLTILAQAVEVLILVGGAAWKYLLTLPKEIFVVATILSVMYIIYEYKEYEITGSLTGAVLSIVAILFILLSLVILL